MSQENFDPTTTTSETSKEKVDTPTDKKIVVGFWLRVVSDSLDALILGLFGFLLAFPLKEQFIKLGPHRIGLDYVLCFFIPESCKAKLAKGKAWEKDY